MIDHWRITDKAKARLRTSMRHRTTLVWRFRRWLYRPVSVMQSLRSAAMMKFRRANNSLSGDVTTCELHCSHKSSDYIAISQPSQTHVLLPPLYVLHRRDNSCAPYQNKVFRSCGRSLACRHDQDCNPVTGDETFFCCCMSIVCCMHRVVWTAVRRGEWCIHELAVISEAVPP